MKRVAGLLLAVGLLAGCGSQPGDKVYDAGGDPFGGGDIRVWHDDGRKVTCWVYVGVQKGGISCLPDSDVARQ